jgi:hypothetical protein
MSKMREAMISQPDELARLLADEAPAEAAANRLAGRRVRLIGIGTSWHAAHHGAWMLREAGIEAEARPKRVCGGRWHRRLLVAQGGRDASPHVVCGRVGSHARRDARVSRRIGFERAACRARRLSLSRAGTAAACVVLRFGGVGAQVVDDKADPAAPPRRRPRAKHAWW